MNKRWQPVIELEASALKLRVSTEAAADVAEIVRFRMSCHRSPKSDDFGYNHGTW